MRSMLFMTLVCLFVVGLLLANLIAGKLIVVFGWTLPAAVIIFPITYILGDLFTEVYGFRQTRRIIWLGFFCNLIAVIVFFVTVKLPHPSFWPDQAAYSSVFGTTPRILVASFVSYLTGEFLNSTLLSKIKVATGGKKLWFRTIGSSVVGQGFDTLLFISIAFWGLYPNNVIFQMILFQYIWKLSYEIILTPFVYLAISKVKKIEGIDSFDTSINYNPFSLR
jgi:uncharacterized integral membrane protein (TIGR00697 family)